MIARTAITGSADKAIEVISLSFFALPFLDVLGVAQNV